MGKTQQYDAAALLLDRSRRLLARKRAHGILRGKTAVLIQETTRLRKAWGKRLLRPR